MSKCLRLVWLIVPVITLTAASPGSQLRAQPAIGTAVLLEGTIVTMNAAREIIENGTVLIREGRIVALWKGSKPPVGVDISDAVHVPLGRHAYIYPGLINLHDHPFFDMLPMWRAPASHRHPSMGRPLGTEPYANRYQWNSGPPPPEYLRLVSNASTMLTSPNGLGRLVEVIKFGRARMILGGTTATQGGGSNAAYDSMLARNVEARHFGRQRVFSRVPSIASMTSNDQAQLRAGMSAGLVDAWLVHLAEGVRDDERRAGDPVSSRAEFSTLRARQLLNDTTVVVHGIGLEADDYREMAQAPAARADGIGDGRGAKLVWSPLSNLLLYGRTAAVYDAVDAGVVVSLGTDWTPSGSPNLLTELKIADRVLRDQRHATGRDAVARDRLLVEMATINPAMAVRWDDQVGSIEVGKAADLLIVDARRRRTADPGTPYSPYRILIDATEQDVSLVMVNGVAQSGDVAAMASLKPGDFEIVASATGCFTKAIDVTSSALPKGTQTLADVTTILHDSLLALGGDHPPAAGGPSPPFTNTWSYLKVRVPGAAGLPDALFNLGLVQAFGMTPDARLNLEAITLPPLFVADDHWWFSTLHGAADADPPYAPYASNTNYLFARGDLQDRYYRPRCSVK